MSFCIARISSQLPALPLFDTYGVFLQVVAE